VSVIPDSIEPVEAFRCWTLVGGQLKSLNGGGVDTVWTPGEPLVAKCNVAVERYRWSVERGGMTYEQAQDHGLRHNNRCQASRIYSYMASPPKVELPVGYGFVAEAETHEAPHENCICGIYAASTESTVPASGNVYGKVKLWGKVVPGERGYRAEIAYPSEFRVSSKLASHPALLAFGVPIIIDNDLRGSNASTYSQMALLTQQSGAQIFASPGLSQVFLTDRATDHNRSARKAMWWATAFNITAGLANVAFVARHFLG
jgi:hypothetical protein